MLRMLFEDLCLRLQHLKPHDVIRIVGFREYESSPILNVNNHKRNNFYFIGVALRQIIGGSTIHFSDLALKPLKNFIECRDYPYRTMVMNLLREHKTQLEINAFSQILIQQTIEQAIELKNPTCTI